MFTSLQIFVVLVITVFTTKDVQCAMTEAQVKSAGKMMRNVCQPKLKVTNAQLDAMHQGEFTDSRELKCYMECILRTAQIMKDGKINLDAVRAQMVNLPPNLAATATAGFEKCKDVVTSAEKCEAAYEFYKCYYDADPEAFFLP